MRKEKKVEIKNVGDLLSMTYTNKRRGVCHRDIKPENILTE